MGRRIPVAGDREQLPLHPALSLSLMVVGMAATMVIITGMCGFGRKRASPSSDPSAKVSDEQQKPDSSSLSLENDQEKMPQSQATDQYQDEDGVTTASLPLPPALQALSDNYDMPNFKSHSGMKKSMSTRNIKRLKSNLSSTVSRSMSMNMRQINKVKNNVAHKGKNVEHMIIKPKQEDSLWKKQIILGEKCRVPVEDEDEIIYDTKGNRISTYHQKTTSSLSMSATTSLIDLNAFAVHEKEKKIVMKEEDS